jgi:hypothetical protein
MRAAWMALTGEDPELLGVLRAYPRRSSAAQSDWGDDALTGARKDPR